MTSCLSGAGGRTYGFDFDLVKSPSTSTRTSPASSSPSSTISESRNSPLSISTKKPRTPRKRPNQTYNEATALLSTANPNLFSTQNLKKPGKFTKPADPNFSEDSSELLLLPFRVSDSSCFLFHQTPFQHKPNFPMEPKVVNLQEKPCDEISSKVNSLVELEDDCQEDFDAESIILDEEIEEGIDSIMGSREEESNGSASCHNEQVMGIPTPWMMNWNSTGYGSGGKMDFRVGLPMVGVRALRNHVDDGNWWNFPAVDILEISPKINDSLADSVPATEKKQQTTTTTKKKKKKKKVEKPSLELPKPKENSFPKSNPSLLLKLDYEEVRNAWSERGSPFVGDESPGADVREMTSVYVSHLSPADEENGNSLKVETSGCLVG